MMLFSTCYLRKRKESLRQIGLGCRVEWGCGDHFSKTVRGGLEGGHLSQEEGSRCGGFRAGRLHLEHLARVRVQGQCCLPRLAGVGEPGGSSGVPSGRAGSLGTHPYSEAGRDLPSVVEAWHLLEGFNLRRNDRIYTGTLFLLIFFPQSPVTLLHLEPRAGRRQEKGQEPHPLISHSSQEPLGS